MAQRNYQFTQSSIDFVAQARETAIDLGYDYISSIHFFIADCNMKSPYSLAKPIFGNENELGRFIESQRLNKEDLLHFNDESLPLTLEAEAAIRNSEQERLAYGQRNIYPFHIMLAAFKVADSAIANCLQNQILEADLIKFYKTTGALELDKLTDEEMAAQQNLGEESKLKKLFSPVRNIFKRK